MQFNNRKTYSILLLLFAVLMQPVTLLANNILVSNVSITKQNTTAGTNNVANFSSVKFDLSWENSWRINAGPNNWDAAWVFVKFRVGATNPIFNNVTLTNASNTITLNNVTNLRVGMPVRVSTGTSTLPAGTVITSINTTTNVVTLNSNATTTASNNTLEFIRIWEHAYLNNTGHTAASGSVIDAGLLNPSTVFNATTNPAVGVFIYRSNNGTGNNNFTNTQLRWNYGANGIADDANITVNVYAIEMVYVPGGFDFCVGGGSGADSFALTTINTSNPTLAPSGIGSLGGQAGGYPTGQIAPNPNWPNGYNAFYCMKYEISQSQYRDFLNSLTYQQQVTRTAVAPTSAAGAGALSSTNDHRNGIDIQTPGNATTLLPAIYGCNLNANTIYNEATDGEWIACNFLSWMDGCAYMQWSGLRPMTELEFIKSCRGNQPALDGEYAWGDTTINGVTGISNPGANNESVSNTEANAAFEIVAGVQGPLRVGAFAGANSTRQKSGATYYGIMEMSGNLSERIVTIGNLAGRSYTGQHGNGTLFSNGTANVDFWPGINGNTNNKIALTAFGGITGVVHAAGSGFCGGHITSTVNSKKRLLVSDRQSARTTNTSRINSVGFRGVRTAQ